VQILKNLSIPCATPAKIASEALSMNRAINVDEANTTHVLCVVAHLICCSACICTLSCARMPVPGRLNNLRALKRFDLV
jgi:DNA polymerase III epsilon subunit-like protein